MSDNDTTNPNLPSPERLAAEFGEFVVKINEAVVPAVQALRDIHEILEMLDDVEFARVVIETQAQAGGLLPSLIAIGDSQNQLDTARRELERYAHARAMRIVTKDG